MNYGKVLNILKDKKGITMLEDFSRRYDSFQILIATIMSARAKDETTAPIAEKLFKKYPDAKSLSRAPVNDVEKIIKKTGFYRAKTKYIINASKMLLEEFGGSVPSTLEELLRLPGVGRKVANCVLVYAFGKDAIPVDTHVHRISNRLGWVETSTPEQTEDDLVKKIPKKYWGLVNEYLVMHGKQVCKPIDPKCCECAVEKFCAKNLAPKTA